MWRFGSNWRALGTNPRILQNIERILRKRRALTLSTFTADGARRVSDRIWIITFSQYDLGYFDCAHAHGIASGESTARPTDGILAPRHT
jgi:hypothetical protein